MNKMKISINWIKDYVDIENENPKEIHIGDLELHIKTSIRRTEILNIDIGDNRNIDIKSEFDYFNFLVIREDEIPKPLYTYITEFRNDVNPQNEKTEKLTKHYKI